MTEPGTSRFHTAGMAVMAAAAVLAVGAVVFSLQALWPAGDKPKAEALAEPLATESRAIEPEPAMPVMPVVARPENSAPAADTGKQNLSLDLDTIRARQELSRQQAQAFRTIGRESTNLSFQLTEQEIRTMEKEGVRVQ